MGLKGIKGVKVGKVSLQTSERVNVTPSAGKIPPGGGVVFAFHFDLFGGMEGRLWATVWGHNDHVGWLLASFSIRLSV